MGARRMRRRRLVGMTARWMWLRRLVLMAARWMRRRRLVGMTARSMWLRRLVRRAARRLRLRWRMWLHRQGRRQVDPVAGPKVVGVPSAMLAAIEVKDTILAAWVELRIGVVQVRHRNAVLLRNVRQRVTAFHCHNIGIVIGHT
jgi:hypothetical protein